MKSLPIISVITVTYNCCDTIEQTILNVLKQTYLYLEYIVIDGGSTDGTVDVIKKYAHKLAYWVSEPDKGIYDAMNKGTLAATGEWLLFRNSGDFFSALLPYRMCFNGTSIRGKILFTVECACSSQRLTRIHTISHRKMIYGVVPGFLTQPHSYVGAHNCESLIRPTSASPAIIISSRS